ncbi:MAG: glycosyltransferase family 4 protein [Oscillospiraceae bacterium]|nr:glycosyltransferase family 4 protein [Oscillospiraceae bacterium]
MKFWFFSAQYLPTVGGVERYTDSLAGRLVAKGHSATVVTSMLPGMESETVTDSGIKVYRLPVIPVMSGRFPVLKISSRKSALEKMFDEDRPDFCVIQTRFYTNSLFAARLCRKHKVPCIVIEHGTAHLMRGGITGFLGNIYEHVACRYIHWLCPDFYGVSQACCQWLGHFGITTDKVLYNSIDTAVITDTAASGREKLLAKLPDTKNKKIIAFSSRFIPEKGVEQMIQAFEKIKEKYPDVLLVMAGDGPLWEKINGMNVRDVILTGRLPYDENLALIELGDVFCLPTFSEGFATTVLESAALKTVVLTTPTGGSPQLIVDDNHGLLFPDMHPDSIYAALDKALADEQWRKTAAENAYNNLQRNFTWNITSEKLEKIAIEKNGF